jgi:hypothetical protein
LAFPNNQPAVQKDDLQFESESNLWNRSFFEHIIEARKFTTIFQVFCFIREFCHMAFNLGEHSMEKMGRKQKEFSRVYWTFLVNIKHQEKLLIF